jgi:hypothetical protein
MIALAKYAGMEVLEVFTQRSRADFAEYDELWQDTVLICKKPEIAFSQKMRQFIRQSMNRYLAKYLVDVEHSSFMVYAQLCLYMGSQSTEINSLKRRFLSIDPNIIYSIVFDLQGYQINLPPMKEIRFDPASEPIEFDLTEAKVIYRDGNFCKLKVISHNGKNNAPGGGYIFNHNDPIIIFDSSLVDFAKVDYVSFSGKLKKL